MGMGSDCSGGLGDLCLDYENVVGLDSGDDCTTL